MFPRVATWAKHLTETYLNKHPATNGALRIILENPPPTANKEFVLDGRPVLAALLDFDADNGTFHMKSPLRNGARDDAPVNNVPEDEEDSDTGAENETMYLSKKIAKVPTTGDPGCPMGLDSVSILPSGILGGGSGVDLCPFRTSEVLVTPWYLVPVPVNLNDTSCPCYDVWSSWCLAKYPAPLTPLVQSFWSSDPSWNTFVWTLHSGGFVRVVLGGIGSLAKMNTTAAQVTGRTSPSINSLGVVNSFEMLAWAWDIKTAPPTSTNEFLMAGCFVDMTNTVNLLDQVTPTPSGFTMLLTAQGAIISIPPNGFNLLFSRNYTSSEIFTLWQAPNAQFDKAVINMTLDGHDLVEITENNKTRNWFFVHEHLTSVPWILGLLAPENEVIGAGQISILPPSIELVLSSDEKMLSHTNFSFTVSNNGSIPLNIMIYSSDRTIVANSSFTLPAQSAVTVRGMVMLESISLPLEAYLKVIAEDGVTAEHFCFSYTTVVTLQVKLNTPVTKIVVGILVGALCLVLLGAIAVFLGTVKYFRKKMATLYPVEDSVVATSTPAAHAIQKLERIINKSNLGNADTKDLTEIIQLIKTDKLHHAEYLDKRKAGTLNIDTEVDKFLVLNLFNNSAESGMSVSAHELPLPSEKTETLAVSWQFDAILDAMTLAQVAQAAFLQAALCPRLIPNTSNFVSWLNNIQANYRGNPYHNAHHAKDVTQAVLCLVTWLQKFKKLSDHSLLALLYAAVSHDVGHPGKNNVFCYQTLDPLALLYNGISILENFHTSESFRLLLQDNWLTWMSRDQFLQFHKSVAKFILGTDMARHVELMSQFNLRVSSNAYNPDTSMTLDDEVLLLTIILKFADVSNPSRPWEICQRWTRSIEEEFFEQGEKEKSLNLTVSAFMDRDSPRTATCQVAFIEHIVLPLAQSLGKVIPEVVSFCVPNLQSNLTHWKEQVAHEH
ncbi:HD-domain PDEase [Pelomyxa schiedti]|nr:HD-domain PDEase [Pelomyxa schiedti]